MRSALLILAAMFGTVAMTMISAEADGLASVRWQYRPVLVFTPSPHHKALSRQTTIFADAAAGLTDRRIAVYIVEADRVFTTFGAPAPKATSKALRQRFRVRDDEFRVVLIGLDGGQKLASSEPVAVDALFGLIDGMPMRRRELMEREKSPK